MRAGLFVSQARDFPLRIPPFSNRMVTQFRSREELRCALGEWMTPEENKKLVLDHYEALYREDAGAVRKQLAAGFVDHEAPLGSMPPGPEAVLRAFESVYRAFPD